MAPATKKLRRLATEKSFVDHLTGKTYISQPPATTSLLSLPIEIFDMVLSHFHDIDEEDILRNPTHLPIECRERTDVLRALSQTSKGLRSACLALAWERVDASTAAEGSAWYQEVSARLENASKLLENRPYLAQHVK